MKTQRNLVDKIALSAIRIILGVLIGMQIFVPIVMTYHYIHPSRINFQETPEDYGIKYEQVEYKTQDDLSIKGWFIPIISEIKSPGILLVHGVGTNRSDVLDVAKFLHDDGYAVLLFDLRGHGLSDGDKTTFGLNEIYDISASFQFLSQQKNVDESRLGVYAISMGASSAILADNEMSFVNKFNKALVLDSPYASLDLLIEDMFSYERGYITPIASFISKETAKYLISDDLFKDTPLLAVRKIEKPIFFIHGAEDTLINKKHSILLYDQKKLGEKDIWLIPLSDHLEGYSSNKIEYEEKVKLFFDKVFKK